MARTLTFCAGVLASWLFVAGTNAQEERFEDAASVVLVEVPVQVVREGGPVRGLTADHFELVQGGRTQQLVGFDVIDLGEIASNDADRIAAQEVPVTARRHFLLLFDLTFSSPADMLKARRAAQTLVDESLHPSDLVGVATYSQLQGVEMIVSFTPDRSQTQTAIRHLGTADAPNTLKDPFNLTLAEPSQPGADRPLRGRASGDSDGLLTPETQGMPSVTQEANRGARLQQVTALIRAFKSLAQVMGSVPGRKHIIYLSSGFDSDLVLGAEPDPLQADVRGVADRLSPQQMFGDTSSLSALGDLVDELRRADCVVQSVDISGVRSAGSGGRGGEQGLFYLANETGGELLRNYNDLGEAMGEVLDRTSVTYVLSYQPASGAKPGAYQKLKVKLKGVPRGTNAVHRPGYYTPKPFAELTALERRFRSAGDLLDGRSGNALSTSMLVAPFPTRDSTAYVPVLVDVDGSALLGAKSAGVLPVAVHGYAIDQSGRIVEHFSQSLGLDLDQALPTLRETGLRFWGDFELAPGLYTIRVLTQNQETGEKGTTASRLVVPDAGASPTLQPPLFPDTQNRWLMAREEPRTDARRYDYPFMLNEQAFIPDVQPVFERGEPTPVVLVALHPGEGEPRFSATLLDRAGTPKKTLSIPTELDSRSARKATWIGTVPPIRNLSSGHYWLEITASEGAEDGEIKAPRIAVRVR